MNKTIKNLTPKQSRALEILISGGSVVQAAETAKVSRGTIYAWLDQAEFINAMNDTKAKAMDQLAIALMALGGKAIKTLDTAMEDPRAGVSARIRAADIVINRILTMREMVDFENRLSSLEAAINKRIG